MSPNEDRPIRLVVSDVDGTLVDKDKKLTQATIEAVGRLRDAGVAFTIISARPRSGMMPIAEKLEIDDAMGAFNGGTVFRRDGTVICQHRIDPEVVRAMFDLVGDAKVDRWVFADDKWYGSSDQGAHVEHERIASDQDPVIIDDFTPFYDRADKLTFVSDDADLLGDLHKQAKSLGERATIMQSQTYYLDVTALAANKGDGIKQLAGAMEIPLSACVAIGDQANDVPMFECAGLSIAMGQGPSGVRDKADVTTAGNDEDGVAKAIDDVILPRMTQ